MAELPESSIVILTHNRKNILCENLISIKKGKHQPDEIIVVDNNSTDGTAEMIGEKFPNVRLLRLCRDTGIEGFNIGVINAKYEYVAMLDDDVHLPENWLYDLLLKFAQEPDSTAVISPKLVEPNMPEELLNSSAMNTERYIALFEGAGVIIRKKPFIFVGFYPYEFFLYGNERDLAARLLNAGYNIKYYPKVVTYHKKPFGIRLGRENLYFTVRNYLWVLFKYYSAKNIIKTIFYIFTSSGAKKNVVPSMDLRAEEGFTRLFKVESLYWIIKAVIDALLGFPYCIKNRQVCKHKEYKLMHETWKL